MDKLRQLDDWAERRGLRMPARTTEVPVARVRGTRRRVLLILLVAEGLLMLGALLFAVVLGSRLLNSFLGAGVLLLALAIRR